MTDEERRRAWRAENADLFEPERKVGFADAAIFVAVAAFVVINAAGMLIYAALAQ